MAALPTTRLTLADMLKYLDPKGRGAPVVELLAQRGMKEIQGYLGLQPGNLPTGHQFSVRTALPTAYLRDYNDGVTPSKSATAQLTEGMSIIESWSEVDCAEAKLNGQEAFTARLKVLPSSRRCGRNMCSCSCMAMPRLTQRVQRSCYSL